MLEQNYDTCRAESCVVSARVTLGAQNGGTTRQEEWRAFTAPMPVWRSATDRHRSVADHPLP
jgi:hypothetical protein